MADKPLLELSTLAPERKTIKIDGVSYELSLMDDFGLREQQLLRSRSLKLGPALNDPESLSDEDWAAADEELRRILPLMIRGCSEEVLDKLGRWQRTQVLVVFTEASGLTTKETEEETT